MCKTWNVDSVTWDVKSLTRTALNNNVLKRGMLFTQHPMRSRCCTRTATTLTSLRFFHRSFIHCQQRCSVRKKGSAGQGGKPTWTSWNEPWLVVPDITLLVTKANKGDLLCNSITAVLNNMFVFIKAWRLPRQDNESTFCFTGMTKKNNNIQTQATEKNWNQAGCSWGTTGIMRMTDKQHEQTPTRPSWEGIKQAVKQHGDCQGSY